MKPEYRDSLYLIEKYITCEGRFALIFLYHLCLLSHLVDDQKISLPYYFHKSLVKMATKCRNPGIILDSYLFHHGLVKLHVLHALRKMRRSWDQFLRFEGVAGAYISQKMTSAMPMRAPSNRKIKKKVLGRTSRSSNPPALPTGLGHVSEDNLEAVGMDAPKEPIQHLVLETPPMRTHCFE